MKYGNVTGEIFADAFAVCRARMRKTAKRTARPKAECTAAAEKAVRGSPPKPAVRGSPAKAPPCGETPPKPAAVRGSPAKPRRRAANRAEYKKSGGSYDPPLAWFIFVSLLKTNISLALVI